MTMRISIDSTLFIGQKNAFFRLFSCDEARVAMVS
jgi:hypothetical protein